MGGRRKISAARLKVYELAAEGNCAKTIGQELGKTPATISGHISALEKEGYLSLASGTDQVKIYEKGPRGKLLDILLQETSSEKSHEGRSPTHVKHRTSADNTELVERPPNYREIPLPPSCDVHSHGVRARVVKPGDIETISENGQPPRPFMEYKPLNNGVDQWFGKVQTNDQEYSVKYMSSPNSGPWLYVWVQGTFTKDELEQGDIEERLMAQAQDVFNHLSKYAGWQFGIMEAHKGSKTHYVPSSSLVDALAQELPTDTLASTEQLHYDETPPREDGQPTPETKDKGTAIALMTDIGQLAKDYKDMKVLISVMVEDRQALLQTVNQSVYNQQALIKILKAMGIPEPGEPGTGGSDV